MEIIKSKDEINQQLLEYGIQLGKLTGYELCQYNLDDTLLKQGEEMNVNCKSKLDTHGRLGAGS